MAMEYFDLFNHLKNLENYDDDEIIVDDQTVIRNFDFASKHKNLLPGNSPHEDNYEFVSLEEDGETEPDIIQQMLNKQDDEILENLNFRYHTMSPRNGKKANGIIFMFHGFNEKHWIKYLPWAKYIVDRTGKTVVFFPIAFHMNRAPSVWSETRKMYTIAQQRKERHPEIIHSTLSNVAISTRLHNKPQRFIWSGLQTYYDIIDFIEYVKAGKHPIIEANASIDILSYSIGTFLGEILMMTNHKGYFEKSRLASFCGGAVFNRLSPVSKFILDSEANVSLYSYVVEHIESHMKRDKKLGRYLSDAAPEGVNFRSMLDYKSFTKQRESLFRRMSDRIYAVTLAQDTVVPPYEVINTLQGTLRDIPIRVDIEDLPYNYKHEDPFPPIQSIANVVESEFKRIFAPIADFLT